MATESSIIKASSGNKKSRTENFNKQKMQLDFLRIHQHQQVMQILLKQIS